MKNTLKIAAMVVILILANGLNLTWAADYPTQPLTLIIGAAPGGSIDIYGRFFATVAEKYLGQPVIPMNKEGAGGMIGLREGVRAAPDGYTLTVVSTGATIVIESEISRGRKPPFTRQDFIPIGSWAKSPIVIIVPYDKPWKTLGDLIKDCKDKPGYYSFCSGGAFSMSHLPAAILVKATGIKVRHVPYPQASPCLASVVGGHVDFATQFPTTSIPLARGNKVRILAVQDNQRHKSLPNVPSVKELGIDAVFTAWQGIGVPKQTPLPIVEKLKEVFKKTVEDKTFIDMVEKTGDEVHPMIGDEVAKYWQNESEMLGKIFKELVKEETK